MGQLPASLLTRRTHPRSLRVVSSLVDKFAKASYPYARKNALLPDVAADEKGLGLVPVPGALKDLPRPISLVAVTPYLLAVNPNVPAKSVG